MLTVAARLWLDVKVNVSIFLDRMTQNKLNQEVNLQLKRLVTSVYILKAVSSVHLKTFCEKPKTVHFISLYFTSFLSF